MRFHAEITHYLNNRYFVNISWRSLEFVNMFLYFVRRTYPLTHLPSYDRKGYEFDEANIFEGAFYPCIIAAPYQGALKVQFKEIIVLLLYIL